MRALRLRLSKTSEVIDSSLRQQVQELQSPLRRAVREREGCRADARRAQEQLAEAEAKLLQAQDSERRLQQELCTASGNEAEAKMEAAALRVQVCKVQAELELAQAGREELSGEVGSLKKQMDSLRDQLESVTSELQARVEEGGREDLRLAVECGRAQQAGEEAVRVRAQLDAAQAGLKLAQEQVRAQACAHMQAVAQEQAKAQAAVQAQAQAQVLVEKEVQARRQVQAQSDVHLREALLLKAQVAALKAQLATHARNEAQEVRSELKTCSNASCFNKNPPYIVFMVVMCLHPSAPTASLAVDGLPWVAATRVLLLTTMPLQPLCRVWAWVMAQPCPPDPSHIHTRASIPHL